MLQADCVFAFMKEAGMTLKRKQCLFITSKIRYLRYVSFPGKLGITAKAMEAMKKLL